MTRPFRFLGAETSSATTAITTPLSEQQSTLDSDFVVILAPVLCALICVLALIAVARCAWLFRLSTAANSRTSPQPPLPSAANKGLKKKVLKSLPKHTFSSDSAPKLSDCAICLAEFTAGDEIRVLPHCGHGFHVSCIDTWLLSHSSCPSCRQILVAPGVKSVAANRRPPAAQQLKPKIDSRSRKTTPIGAEIKSIWQFDYQEDEETKESKMSMSWRIEISSAFFLESKLNNESERDSFLSLMVTHRNT